MSSLRIDQEPSFRETTPSTVSVRTLAQRQRVASPESRQLVLSQATLTIATMPAWIVSRNPGQADTTAPRRTDPQTPPGVSWRTTPNIPQRLGAFRPLKSPTGRLTQAPRALLGFGRCAGPFSPVHDGRRSDRTYPDCTGGGGPRRPFLPCVRNQRTLIFLQRSASVSRAAAAPFYLSEEINERRSIHPLELEEPAARIGPGS